MPIDESTVVSVLRVDSSFPLRPPINVEYVPLEDGSKYSYVLVKFGNYTWGSIRVPGHIFEVKIEVSSVPPYFQEMGVSDGKTE